ncbi:MAG: hypothetical protein HY334_00790 [Armatimonadetes bacterium]|nr:hypothetical protein [Armatimonadota bacterium]
MQAPVPQSADRLARLADYVTLVYHEARNVRHLIRARAVEPEQWKYLVALPVNRHEAWQALQEVRVQARRVKSTAALLRVFERRFRVSLAQLVALYGQEAWRDAPYGGNAWETVAGLVGQLASCLEAGRLSAADGLLEALSIARHNTGAVRDKLSQLDRGLGREPEA